MVVLVQLLFSALRRLRLNAPNPVGIDNVLFHRVGDAHTVHAVNHGLGLKILNLFALNALQLCFLLIQLNDKLDKFFGQIIALVYPNVVHPD